MNGVRKDHLQLLKRRMLLKFEGLLVIREKRLETGENIDFHLFLLSK